MRMRAARRQIFPRVNDNQDGASMHTFHDMMENHRMCFGHIGADQHNEIRIVEILIGNCTSARTKYCCETHNGGSISRAVT